MRGRKIRETGADLVAACPFAGGDQGGCQEPAEKRADAGAEQALLDRIAHHEDAAQASATPPTQTVHWVPKRSSKPGSGSLGCGGGGRGGGTGGGAAASATGSPWTGSAGAADSACGGSAASQSLRRTSAAAPQRLRTGPRARPRDGRLRARPPATSDDFPRRRRDYARPMPRRWQRPRPAAPRGPRFAPQPDVTAGEVGSPPAGGAQALPLLSRAGLE